MSKYFTASLAVALLAFTGGLATPAVADEDPVTWFEIFKLAPGKQEQFVRSIALEDEVSMVGGQPPIPLVCHQHGAEWDVLLM